MADLGESLSAITRYGGAREAEGRAAAEAEAAERIAELNAAALVLKAERDAAVADVEGLNTALSVALQTAETQALARAELQAEYAAHMATHEPVPVPVPPVLIGMSSPVDLWDARESQVEATGGRLQARRLFFQSLTDSTAVIRQTADAGLVPVCSWKVGSSWASVASGSSDNQLKALALELAAIDKPVHVAFHHEPDQQSTPPDVGEGGSAADFASMQSHIIDVMRPLAPKVKFAVIVNGWWFTSQARKLTDAQIEVWLPRSLRDKLDVIAADDYSPQSGEEAVVKTRNRVAWANRVGGVKATGVGETNAFSATQLRNVFDYAKSEPLFQGGWILVWNSTGDAYRPLDETGLLDDFQSILVGWTE